jgi:hypothetical protein
LISQFQMEQELRQRHLLDLTDLLLLSLQILCPRRNYCPHTSPSSVPCAANQDLSADRQSIRPSLHTRLFFDQFLQQNRNQ